MSVARMRIVVLTTETLHHSYFVRELIASYSIELVVIEGGGMAPPFETHHAFEDQRDAYESATLFGGCPMTIDRLAETLEVESASDAESLDRLRRIHPEVMVVFGTGRLSGAVIELCPDGIVNLHGGDPEHYRGLDSHLWAIYHGQYQHMKVTLHRVNERLDDGEMISRRPLPIHGGMKLHELRRVRTDVCIALSRDALRSFNNDGRFESTPQRQVGRYYSFMPAVLKGICRKKFESQARER